MSTPRSRAWLVERAAAGELENAAELLTAAEKAEVEALRRENEMILASHPPAAVAEEVRRRLRLAEAREKRARRSIALVAAPIAAAAAAVVIAALSFDPVSSGSNPAIDVEPTRIKGDRALSIHLKKEGRSERLAEGDAIRRGDLLQLAYGAGEKKYGVVVSIDGAGAATLHLPQSAQETSAKLEARETELPFSYELDAAPDFERFFLITADAPFSAEEIFRAAQALASDPNQARSSALRLPAEYFQTSVLLKKVSIP